MLARARAQTQHSAAACATAAGAAPRARTGGRRHGDGALDGALHAGAQVERGRARDLDAHGGPGKSAGGPCELRVARRRGGGGRQRGDGDRGQQGEREGAGRAHGGGRRAAAGGAGRRGGVGGGCASASAAVAVRGPRCGSHLPYVAARPLHARVGGLRGGGGPCMHAGSEATARPLPSRPPPARPVAAGATRGGHAHCNGSIPVGLIGAPRAAPVRVGPGWLPAGRWIPGWRGGSAPVASAVKWARIATRE
jgi:hypothetical protein